jgi:hypothetical protein
MEIDSDEEVKTYIEKPPVKPTDKKMSKEKSIAEVPKMDNELTGKKRKIETDLKFVDMVKTIPLRQLRFNNLIAPLYKYK